ncbi:MAG: TerB family tellurite resistance protein [Pseudomonadota bacterium]|jgi:uncharacterized tellurite resistance protein B-like protein|nr:TerB family tellurite resistance protein [Pseudomonadales bacterium]MEE2607520.1 TerB family tellurite resistance protein [Pseudomonadota bacterium]HAC87895.1 hypothetical protein [Gammaproteobacteria bacterium]HAD71352.1 hypothetical protein [Gammaproteobacteria bacterium]|tara:strand:+ start:3032 stop:3493 length:462 start_codon:yes stop_codon:yes gene_type:complete
MLNSIRQFFENKLVNNEEEPTSSSIAKTDLACAALLIEVINSDHKLEEQETQAFFSVLQNNLNIPGEDIDELVELAENQAKEATSLYEFTSLINSDYDYSQKVGLIENMWRIAFSDNNLDKYEDHLIRKISDLIYVSHSDFIRAKLKVRDASN